MKEKIVLYAFKFSVFESANLQKKKRRKKQLKMKRHYKCALTKALGSRRFYIIYYYKRFRKTTEVSQRKQVDPNLIISFVQAEFTLDIK